MDALAAKELNAPVNHLKTIIPNLAKLVSPIIDTAYDIQDDVGDINLKKGLASHNGLWQTCICDTCHTMELRTECDCTYTIITVPLQGDDKINIQEYYFILELAHGKTIGLKMDISVDFIFSGRFLVHRQARSDKACKTSKDSTI